MPLRLIVQKLQRLQFGRRAERLDSDFDLCGRHAQAGVVHFEFDTAVGAG